MNDNALTDIAWVRVRNGRATLRETLLHAHEPEYRLDLSLPGFAISAELRLFAHVLAVVFRHLEHTTGEARYGQILHILRNGLPSEAVDAALAELEPGAHLRDPEMPFLQRPALPEQKKNDTARRLGPNDQAVKKLLPSMPSDQGEDFWNLSFSSTGRLPVEDAVLHIAIAYFFSPAGNNAYDGDKCSMGTPGFRYLGKGNTATEVVWWGETLLETLLLMTPRSWVEGDGLPSWADRTAARSYDSGELHPLWRASWSSNASVCHWEGTELTGVRIGGVPDAWFPPGISTDKNARKQWWDQRNIEDPFYLYRDGKAVRVDFGRDATALAVEWAADSNLALARERSAASLLAPGSTALESDTRLLFIRHQVEGTASSPSIRASSVFVPDDTVWSFDVDEELVDNIAEHATFVKELLSDVVKPFRAPNKNDKKIAARGQVPNVLNALENQRDDAANAFWRRIHDVYADLISSSASDTEIPTETYRRARNAALEAFDFVTAPHLGQYPAKIAFARSRLDSTLSWRIRQRIAPVATSEGDLDE
ncbi:type I-E CRISPR-associated protein Cse1/CasA [Trueperella pyogenes]|uniref:type I-E CRISPR-associated protein Cse1/CasA n=1 Tax=Trueperella pyogenes TaxID=1661 RepID=UPI00312BB92E